MYPFPFSFVLFRPLYLPLRALFTAESFSLSSNIIVDTATFHLRYYQCWTLWVCMVTYYWLNCMPLKPLLGSSWMTLHCTSLISVKARQWIWDEVLITHLLYVCRSCEPWLQYVGGLFCLKNLFLLFCFFFCLISTDYVCVLDIDLLELAITTWKGNDPGKLVCLIMHTTPRSLDLYYNTVLSSSTSSMFRLSHCLSCAVQIMWFTCTPALTPVLL